MSTSNTASVFTSSNIVRIALIATSQPASWPAQTFSKPTEDIMLLRTTDVTTFPMIFLKTAPTPQGLNPGFLLSGMSQQARNSSSQADSSLVQSFLVTLASVLKVAHKNSLITKIPYFHACFPYYFWINHFKLY